MALWRRKPPPGLIHHSDQGVQYTSLSFGKRLEEAGIVPSMGRGFSLRQRPSRILHRYAEEGAFVPTLLANAGVRPNGDLRVLRGLLQPLQAPFSSGL